MIRILATLLLAIGEIPSPPKPGIPPEMLARPEWQFKIAAFELSKRVQTDPNYALMDVDSYAPSATVYFKGDAAAHLAKYTSDPRFKASSVPLSAAELGEISRTFMLWVKRRGFEWDQAWADPKQGLVIIGTRQPYLLEKMARDDHIDLTHIRIGDSRPKAYYVPERG